MSAPASGPAGYWSTVGLLLRFARRRSRARAERQRQLLGQKGKNATEWGGVGTFFTVLLAAGLQGLLANLLFQVLDLSERLGAEASPAAVARHPWGLAWTGILQAPAAALLASLVPVAWFLVLAFQGEGVDLDLQRRRHPMWEWLLAHPIQPGAAFTAEMLSPLAANPLYWVAPVFWIGAFWIAYDDPLVGLAAGLLAGLPLSVAGGCVGKAVEIGAVLRLPPRSRGAALGILAWLGQAASILLVVAALTPALLLGLTRFVARVAGGLRLPILEWALGLGGDPAPWKGVLACWGAALLLIGVAVRLSALATNQGLAGGFGAAASAPSPLADARRSWLLRDPVYRKELLWFWRDRGALVQVFLIPLTIAGYQVWNLRRLANDAPDGWHVMAGASVIFGSWFLFSLGPRSLLSEGAALWIPLTWPRGLEALLKAKARLWWLASLVVVGPLLLLTAVRFPSNAWQVALVGLVWAAFSRSLAEKGVTLAGAPSSAGEPEPVPRGRRWAASLGTLTFGAGIFSQQWHLALIGVVFSWLTAAAMWQNFRARLPFLLDPWSERAPPPPTLMHAMVAISAMSEGMAVVFALSVTLLGRDSILLAQAVAYGLCGITVFVVMNSWLAERDVLARDVWRWGQAALGPGRMARSVALGCALGLVLGLAALGYQAWVEQLPEWGKGLRETHHLALRPIDRRWMALMAVGLAPLAEEYLFRGLLFRALDREWGGWRALLGSAAFFAIYHPPQAWLPVALVGVACALLFKRTGHLLPSVALHLSYNALVLWVS